MKKSELIALLKPNTQYTVEQTNEMEKLLEEFPFFNTAQIMLSVAYHQHENLKFEKQLRKAAAYANDRKKLHELHFDQSENENKVDEKPSLHRSEISEQPKIDARENKEIKQAEEVSAQEELPKAPAPEKNREEQQDKTKPNETLDDVLEEQLITAAINSSILLEVDEESKKLEESDSQFNESLGEESQLEEDNDVEKFVENENHSFSDWLSHYSDEPKKKPIWDQASPEAQKGLKAFDQTARRSKQEFYSPAKMARLSVQEDGDLITETLANVYAQQGNYEKAIEAFQKLQLKYPEKKIYFAGQIQRLQDELNS